MADGPAVGDQLPHSLLGNIQQFGGKVAGRVDSLVEKDLIPPDIHYQMQEIVVLPASQWHRATPSVLYLFSACLTIFSFYQNTPNNQVKGKTPFEKGAHCGGRLFHTQNKGGMIHEQKYPAASHGGWSGPDEPAPASAQFCGGHPACAGPAHPGRLPKGGQVLAGSVAVRHGGQGRTGLGDVREARHHPLSLLGGFRSPHPEPAL